MSRARRPAEAVRDALECAYLTHPVLAVAAGVAAAGMALTFPLRAIHPAQLAGEPAWAGPFNLFTSMAVLCATLLWTGYRLGGSAVFFRAGLVIAAVAVLQPMLAVLRVVMAPGTRGAIPPLDLEVSAAMALLQLALVAACGVLLVELLRRPLGHPSIAWAIRLGLALALCGLALDPARGFPALGGSGRGAFRAAHLWGMHALQLLPLAGWMLSRRRRLRVTHQVTLVAVAAACHAGVSLLLAWQAVRGQVLVLADPVTLAGLVVVLAGGASSSASVLAHARELRLLARQSRAASERRLAMLAQARLEEARRAVLKERMAQAMRGRSASSRGHAVPGATLRIRRRTWRLALEERPTDVEQMAG